MLLLWVSPACQREKPAAEMLIFIMAGQADAPGPRDLGRLPSKAEIKKENIDEEDEAYLRSNPIEMPVTSQDRPEACALDLAPVGDYGAVFGQRLGELMPTVHVGLIPCAQQDTTLSQWALGGKGNSLYDSSVLQAQGAAKRGRVRGVLFYEGVGDTHSRQAVEQWPRHFAALVAAWRRDLGDPKLPVVFAQLGRLGDNRRHDPRYRYWDLLKKKQAALRIPYVAMVRTDDLALKPDGLHLGASGQMFLGRRMAAAMHRLLTHRSPEPDPVADRWVGGAPPH